jgi:predicted amidohydrolase
MRLGLAQLLVEGTEPERNLARAESLVARAASSGCDMVLLPETMDFGWTHPDGLLYAEPIPGRFSDALGEMAHRHGVWLCAGLTERTMEGNFNTAVLMDSSGNILGSHRKINLLTVEFPFYMVGKKLEVFSTPFGKLAMNICADNYWDAVDIGHCLARMGAELILSPSSWTVDHSVSEEQNPYHEKWSGPFRTLAKTHGLVMASATSVGYIVGGPYEGKKMVGCSLCVGPDGVIAQGPFNEFAGELVIADFEVNAPKAKGVQIGPLIYGMASLEISRG